MSEKTKEENMTDNLYTALAKAQTEMGKALKDSNNPHFRSSYADLASVMNACLPALSQNGIAVVQPPYDDETGRYVKTILIHGPTKETHECRVPLIIGKQDMQGYGSAVTYARRYGLMSMVGIAPEDDDGNAAAQSAPKPPSSAEMKRQLADLESDLVDVSTEVQLTALWKAWALKMNNENWPVANPPDDEAAYRNVVKDKFRQKNEQLSQVLEAAE